MIIVTDIDECVLGWADGFYQWLAKNGNFIDNDWREYESVEKWLYKNSIDISKIFEFNDSEDFANLSVIKKADIYIPLLHEMNNTFIALTACGTHPVTIEKRIYNLEKLFPNIFSKIICVNNGHDKEMHLREINGDVWVEDNLRNACLGQDLEYQTFIIDYKHNKNDKFLDMHRVSDWEEIYKKIII